MSSRNSPPLEALLLPDIPEKPRRSWTGLVMGSILAGSILLALVMAVWGLTRLAHLASGGTYLNAGSGNEPTAAAKQAEYRAAFQVPVKTPQDAEMRQVENLLAKYVAAAKSNDEGSLARLLDVNRFLQRMEGHPDMPQLDVSERKALLALLSQNLHLPRDVTDYRLMGFKRLSKSGLAAADVILKNAGGDYEPCRFWLQQHERAWSVVDWEFIQQGKSEAGQRAGRQRAERDYLASSYLQSLENLEQADEHYYRGDIPGAVRLVLVADQATLPGYIHKEMQWAVAHRLYQYHEHQPAIDSLRTVTEPDELPGVFVIRALCYEALGQAEEALAAAADYERLCGFAPEVVRAKGRALVRLKKTDEAVREFRKLLDFDPADQVALKALIPLLPAGQNGDVTQYISRAKHPPQLALALSRELMYGGDDDETIQAIRTLLETKWKNSPETHALVAALHQRDEEFDEAAAAFRRTFEAETDAAKKNEHWHQYVQAMASAGKLVQAYEESKDPAEVFQYLTSGVEAGESLVPASDLPPLIEAHRRRQPDDPRIDYCRGYVASERGDLAAAEKAFAAGEAKAKDEELKSSLQYARMHTLADLGRFLDAYAQYEALDGSFRYLADACRQQHKPDALEELLRRHRKQHPDDQALVYYEAALELERGHHEKALQRLAGPKGGMIGADSGGPDEVTGVLDLVDQVSGTLGANRSIWLKLDIYESYPRWTEALPQDDQFPMLMPRLAERFEQQEKWDKLRELVDLYRPGHEADPNYRLHAMKLAWELGKYDEIAALVPRWFAQDWTAIQEGHQKWVRESLVRSLLRQGKTSAAYAFAEQFQRENAEELQLLMVRIAQGEVGQVSELFARLRAQIHVDFALDPELTPLLTDSAYAALRRQHPLDLPWTSPRISLVLFLREPPALNAEQLQKLVAEEDSEARVGAIPPLDASRQTLSIVHRQGTIFVTVGCVPYHLPESDWQLLKASPEPGKIELKEHKGWLAMELLDAPQSLPQPHDDRLAKRLAAKLLSEKVLAVALDQPATTTRLAPRGVIRVEALTPEISWPQWLSGGIPLWLTLADRPAPDQPLKTKAQRAFVSAVKKLPAGEFAQVKVRLECGHADEECWLKVLGVEREEYGGYRLTCEMQKDSILRPYLKAGEPCSVRMWQVRETKLPASE